MAGGFAAGLGEQSVGEVDDLRGGAVVADELDDGGPGVAAAEVQQVVGGRAGEGVDGLAGVADDAQAGAALGAGPLVEEALLERGDVLVLVDGEVPVLGADLVGDVRAVLQDGGGEQQDVLEVDVSAAGLGLLVDAVDLGGLGRVAGGFAAGLGDGGGVVLGGGLGDLGPFDLGGEVAQFGALDAQSAAAGGLGDELDLAFEELRDGAADGAGPEVLELAQGGGVEGAGLDAVGAELAQAAAHLAGGAGGEGDGEDLLGVVDAAAHAVGDAVGDGPGLAGAGAGEDADGAVQGGGDGALFGVEPGEHGVGARGGAGVGPGGAVGAVVGAAAQEVFLHAFHLLSPVGQRGRGCPQARCDRRMIAPHDGRRGAGMPAARRTFRPETVRTPLPKESPRCPAP